MAIIKTSICSAILAVGIFAYMPAHSSDIQANNAAAKTSHVASMMAFIGTEVVEKRRHKSVKCRTRCKRKR